jgi:hypothetical protein
MLSLSRLMKKANLIALTGARSYSNMNNVGEAHVKPPPATEPITDMDSVVDDIESFWTICDTKKKTLTQLERYLAHESPPKITKFIAIGGGPKMGVTLEAFARHRFSTLQKRKSGKEETGYDHTVVGHPDVYVEQKSSGHWGEDDFKWQHVEPKHKWTVLLLCGIGYTDVCFWTMSRPTFNALVAAKKITNQGNKTGDSSEGMWFNYSCVKDSLTPITSNADLLAVMASPSL